MNFLDKNFGRLGNRMFQSAFLYAYARNKGIDWYYQDPIWFKGYEEEIKELFKQKGEPLDYVAIHVRLGDYVNNPFYVDLSSTDYYQKAIRQFPKERFMVFSDDLTWCMKYFSIDGRSPFSYSALTELGDFNAMTRCKHQIIANSSFSWWAAYLNPNPNKIVIAPSVKNWYSDGVERTVCPPEWIRL